MLTQESEELRDELLSLLDKQLEVLQLSTYVPLTDEEEREFEARRERIRKLFEALHIFRAAA